MGEDIKDKVTEAMAKADGGAHAKRVEGHLNNALHDLGLSPTGGRELAIVKTKIEEALMWLAKK